MFSPVSVLLGVVVAVAALAAGAPSDGWAPASQSRAFGRLVHHGQAELLGLVGGQQPPPVARSATPAPARQEEDDEVEDAAEEDGPEARAAAQNEVGDEDSWLSWLMPSAEMRVVGKVWEDCAARDDTTTCLKGKALTFLDRAAAKDNLALPGGLALVRTARDSGAAKAPVNEAELEASLPRDLNQRDSKLDQMLLDRVLGFVQTHALRFNLAEQGEERGKKKKNLLPYLLLSKLVASSLVVTAAKALTILALKAMMVAKTALLISGIVALKKLTL
ncbi:LOW QUALITY PROTEIN: Thymocyte selection-associated high mobility group box protein TOX [Frankliniella fusca]|uniref:Thymocyte selection-associated high mobility group box protein TOX n=1 Tax=Frankliniella fusca TaxID=407009 RepID=A0AAE1LDI3_9NEOP|nr:LOW QUALITY PROTEIN: Thymocyte selection-associated high mobility group box protein TOX [Frankliniella fusca]